MAIAEPIPKPEHAANLSAWPRVKLIPRIGRTEGVRKIAERFGVNPGTVQRISRPFEGANVGAA